MEVHCSLWTSKLNPTQFSSVHWPIWDSQYDCTSKRATKFFSYLRKIDEYYPVQSGEKMQLFKLRPLVVSGPDSCTGQSVRPVGLPAVCRGAPHVSDHTSPRTQRMLCKNSHPCSGQYCLHHAGIVVTNQNLWNWLSNIFMLSTCLGCTRAGCHITWSPLPILIFFFIIFGVSSKYLIKKIREVHIIAAIQYNRS